MQLIPVHQAVVVVAYTKVDDADYEWLSRAYWRLSEGYPRRNADVRMHREILGLVPGDGMEGDHINGDRLDNRRTNLRVVTHAQNKQNLSSYRGSSSRFRGVCWESRRRKWRAYMTVDGRRFELGQFASEEQAAQVAAEARRQAMPFTSENAHRAA